MGCQTYLRHMAAMQFLYGLRMRVRDRRVVRGVQHRRRSRRDDGLRVRRRLAVGEPVIKRQYLSERAQQQL